jgi:hypothetical protein
VLITCCTAGACTGIWSLLFPCVPRRAPISFRAMHAAVYTLIGPPMQDGRQFTLLNKGAHHGAIQSMDAHVFGSLVVTGGTDHTLRCFDAALGYCIAAQTISDRILHVTLHPACPMVLVALHSSLKLYNILWYTPPLVATPQHPDKVLLARVSSLNPTAWCTQDHG